MEKLDGDEKVQSPIDPIIPIDFIPNNEKGPRVTYKIKWVHLLIGAIAFISVTEG